MVEDPGIGTPDGPPPPPGATRDAVADGPPPPPVAADPWATPGTSAPAWGAASPSAQVGWDRPRSGSNGCLKGCLIVGVILAILTVIGVVGLVVAGGRLAQQIQDNPEAVFGGECAFVSSVDVSDALREDVQVRSLEGLADGTMGVFLDKRLLPDAPDCWIIGESGTTGRIAVLDGGGQSAFAAARSAADGFLLNDVGDLGDEAFCTKLDASAFGGVLVRFGDRVAYVSVLDRAMDSEDACRLARSVAGTLAP